MAIQTAPQSKLIGVALIEHHADGIAAGTPKGEMVRAANYVGVRNDGSERLLFTEYYEELLIARGVMYRVNVYVAEATPNGWQPVHFDTFTVDSVNHRKVARKVRKLTGLTNKRCKSVSVNSGVTLYYQDISVHYSVA